MSRKSRITPDEALRYHFEPVPGKYEITASKPMATQRDLSLAYSPGVAVPVEEIARDPGLAYDYTTKGNMVAVVSNGTAILGLGKDVAEGVRAGLEQGAVRLADRRTAEVRSDRDAHRGNVRLAHRFEQRRVEIAGIRIAGVRRSLRRQHQRRKGRNGIAREG